MTRTLKPMIAAGLLAGVLATAAPASAQSPYFFNPVTPVPYVAPVYTPYVAGYTPAYNYGGSYYSNYSYNYNYSVPAFGYGYGYYPAPSNVYLGSTYVSPATAAYLRSLRR